MKRGQTTIFIIMGVILIAVIIIFLVLRQDVTDEVEIEPVPEDIQPIYDHVEKCIREVGENAIFLISFTGGYYENPIKEENGVSIYFEKGENYMPSLEHLEREISLYMDKNLNRCLKFSEFSEFDIQEEEVETKTKVESDEVFFDVNFLLSISKGERTYELEDFESSVPVRLGLIYAVVRNLTEEQMNTPTHLCISCIDRLATENQLFFEINNEDIETTLFAIVDENSIIRGKEFVYFFKNKY